MKLKDTNLTAEQIMDYTKKYMMESFPRFPFVAERARGQYVYDTEGNAWLDFYAGVAVNSSGHLSPAVAEAVKDQLDDLMHTANYPYTIPQALLAKFVCENIGMEKIFFQNSGTEANEAMIKLARKFGVENFGPHKYEIVTALGSFHGRTFGSLSATGQPQSALHKGFAPLLPGFRYAEFNNLAAFEKTVDENTIAIMLEPVQGEGGVHPATQEFMRGIRALCDEKGLLLLLDEIQTGWGRCGSLMAYMSYGIKPDAVTMAKAMGNGLPIGALCSTEKLAAAFTPGAHGTTFGGNALVCAGAYAAVREIAGKDLAANAAKMGKYFKEKLAALPHTKEIRGSGLLVGVQLDAPKAAEVKKACLNRKFLLTSLGDSVLRMVPPLTITEDDIDMAVEILKAAIEEAYAAV